MKVNPSLHPPKRNLKLSQEPPTSLSSVKTGPAVNHQPNPSVKFKTELNPNTVRATSKGKISRAFKFKPISDHFRPVNTVHNATNLSPGLSTKEKSRKSEVIKKPSN